jgi:hypothetical protein
MSQTAAQGFSDATRWVGVAAEMVDFLDDWLGASESTRPAPPKRALASVKRFMTWVLDGVALNGRSETPNHVPTMATLSNLTIAVEVLTAMPSEPAKDLNAVADSIRSYLNCLSEIEKTAGSPPPSPSTVRELRAFFDELLRQGNSARYAELARGESPIL